MANTCRYVWTRMTQAKDRKRRPWTAVSVSSSCTSMLRILAPLDSGEKDMTICTMSPANVFKTRF